MTRASAVVVGWFLAARPVYAGPAAALIVGDSLCPEPRTVSRELKALLVRTAVFDSGDSPPGPIEEVVVHSDEEHYGVRSSFANIAYDADTATCLARAKTIASFLALSLEPPELGLRPNEPAVAMAPPVKSEPEPAPAAVRPSIAPLGGCRAPCPRVSAGALFAWAPGSSAHGATAAPGLRASGALVGASWVAEMGGSVHAPSSYAVGMVDAHSFRTSLDAGVGVRKEWRDWDVEGSVGPAVMREVLEGRDVPRPAVEAIWHMGGRASVKASRRVSASWAIGGSLGASVWLDDTSLALHSVGQIGETPKVWLDANVFVSWQGN